MNTDETLEFENRLYVNPEVSMAEQDQFIEKFRNLQGQNQAQINRDTYNLGTQVPSNLGGLTGAEGLWNAQYQRPAVNAAIENLRQVNLQQALNTAMQNQQNAMAERINQAKREYNRASARSGGGSGGGNGNQGDVEFKDAETIAAQLQDVPKGSFFDRISKDDSYLPGYASGVSAVTGNTEAERRLKWIAQMLAEQQKNRSK